MRIALEQAGMKCVFSSDINKDCQDVYVANFGERPFGDIKDINPQNIPDFDVLCAGFPCQPFSISGHKKGFEDARGTLFFEILRILEVKKPTTVLLENVKHLIHHNRGETLRIIMQSLKDLGYKISYKILNAKNFGSAQNRERLIIVGHKDRRFNFHVLRRIPNRIIEDILENTSDFEYLKSEEYTLIQYPKRQASGLIFAGYRNKKIRQNGIRPDTLHLSRVHKQPNRIYAAQGTHPTLPSQESSGRFWILHNNKVRKLTIRECYRLQGFPDSFKLSKSQTQQYLQIGNSIYIPMFKEIGQAVIDQLYVKNYKEEIYEQSYTNLRFPLQLSPK